MLLRDYQIEAVAAIRKEFQTVNSTLAVLATGLGKTVIACEVATEFEGRILFLVHRYELAKQAKEKLIQFGVGAQIEMGHRKTDKGWFQPKAVVASVQTLQNEERRKLFNPLDFDLIICDESHHFTAKMFRKTVDWFRAGNSNIKVLGLTATPDRADEQALGEVFETVAFKYDIHNGIEEGYLVPLKFKMVRVESLDLSEVRTTAGELNGKDLAKVLEEEKTSQGLADGTFQCAEDRRTLLFAATVKEAELISEILIRKKANSSAIVSAKTEEIDRITRLTSFDTGRIQFMCNVAVLTEGYDSPGIQIISMCYPTKSRARYVQMVGRGTRPLTGIIDGLETKEERKQAIASSDKPYCTILDFVGNAGKHSLMCGLDILGGTIAPEIAKQLKLRIEKANREVTQQEIQQVREDLERKAEAERERRKGVNAKARLTVTDIDPFSPYAILKIKKQSDWGISKKLSAAQRAKLEKSGINPNEVSWREGVKMLGELGKRMKKGLSTLKQVRRLGQYGYTATDWTFEQAHAKMTAIANNNWHDPAPGIIPSFTPPPSNPDWNNFSNKSF